MSPAQIATDLPSSAGLSVMYDCVCTGPSEGRTAPPVMRSKTPSDEYVFIAGADPFKTTPAMRPSGPSRMGDRTAPHTAAPYISTAGTVPQLCGIMPPNNQFCGVRDSPIPSTDQVISLVVHDFATDTPAKTVWKYYVPPGGVVVAWDQGSGFVLSDRGVGRGRSVANKVYKVTSGYHLDAELGAGFNDAKKMAAQIAAGAFRVFGVAYDGVSVANASLAKDPKNRDATGRFSAIFTGIATVSMPYKTDQPAFMMESARIGDTVIVNPFNTPGFNFKGDPEDYTGYGLTIVSRKDWMALTGDSDDNKTEIRKIFFDVFTELEGDDDTVLGLESSTVSDQIKRIFGACCLGYVLATGGRARNEVTVQLDLNSFSRYWGCATNEESTSADVDGLRADAAKWKTSFTEVNAEIEGVHDAIAGAFNTLRQTPVPGLEDGAYDSNQTQVYIAAATEVQQVLIQENPKLTRLVINGKKSPPSGQWKINPDNVTVSAGMIDVGAPMISTGGSLKRKRGAFAEVVEAETAGMLGDDGAGDPCQSLLGLVGGAVASDSVGTVLYSTMNPGTAATVLAKAPAVEVGLTPAGRGMPGTFAGEMLGAGAADPETNRKVAARAEFLESLCSHTLPRSIDGNDPKTMSWGVSPTVETALKGTPDAVIQAIATHGDNGHSIPSAKLVGAWVDATQYRPAAAADGASLGVYGDMPNAVQFQTIHLPEAMDVVRGSGKAVHNLPADSQQRILDAAALCLRGKPE